MIKLLLLLVLVGCESTSQNKGITDVTGGSKKSPTKQDSSLCKGGLKVSEVQSVMKGCSSERGKCYELLLEKEAHPYKTKKTEGKITLKFVIGILGHVDTVKIINSTIKNTDFQNCIIRTINNLKFPVPRCSRPVTIRYPFSFSPR